MRPKIVVPRYVQYIVLPLALLFSFFVISAVRTIVIMFALAFVIALVMDLPVSRMHSRLRIPRLLAVLLLWLVILAVFALLLAFLIPNIISELNTLIENFPAYSGKVEQVSADLQNWFREADLPYKPDITPQEIAAKLESGGVAIASWALDAAQSLFNLGLNIALMFIISIYMLLDIERLKDNARRAVPAAFREDAEHLFARLQKALGSYIRGQLLLSAVMGILGGIIAFYGGSGKYIFIVAVWVAITEVIPLIGPLLGAAPAVILAWFAVSPGRALVVALLFLAVQQLEGHILVPRIMGRSVGVHPLWVMFAVLSGGTIAGFMGALLAVPTVAMVKVLIDFSREEVVLEKWQRPLLEKK
jgi:predicted PurR-regulated permease PerM